MEYCPLTSPHRSHDLNTCLNDLWIPLPDDLHQVSHQLCVPEPVGLHQRSEPPPVKTELMMAKIVPQKSFPKRLSAHNVMTSLTCPWSGETGRKCPAGSPHSGCGPQPRPGAAQSCHHSPCRQEVNRAGDLHQMYLTPMSLPPPCRRLRAVTSPVVAEYIREVVVCWHVSYLLITKVR